MVQFNSTGFRTIGCALAAILAWLAADAARGQPASFVDRAEQGGVPATQEPEFTFVRAVYTSLRPWGYYKGWYTDWPKADRQFLLGLQRLTNIRVAKEGKTIPLTDPELFRHPFLYAVEVGQWDLSDEEAASLGEYLRRGGFLFCDDFWGSLEWANFERNMRRVLPECRIIELPRDHPLFHAYYDIQEVIQTPNVGNAIERRPTYEQDGFVPHCRGISDESGRLMVVINWNTDLGDAWEWADLPGYPARYSTYAYQVGINAIVYSMSH
jgi:hypothetical protein